MYHDTKVTAYVIYLYSYIGIAVRNEVINVFTRAHNHYDEPRLIKCDENDEEITLVTINDFLVQGVCIYNHIYVITYI